MRRSFLHALGLCCLTTALARAQTPTVTLDEANTVRSVSATSDALGDGGEFPGPNANNSVNGFAGGTYTHTAHSETGTTAGSTASATGDQNSQINLNPFSINWTGSVSLTTSRFGFDSETSAVARSVGDFVFDVGGAPASYSLSGNTSPSFFSQGDFARVGIQLSGPSGLIADLSGDQQTLTGTLAPGHYELLATASGNFDDMFPASGNDAMAQGMFTLTLGGGGGPKPLPGDANLDGKVNFTDLLILAQHYGLKTGQAVGTGDFNADGGVGFDDLLVLAQNYGKMSAAPAVTPVPEPTAIGLFMLLAVGTTSRRRRRA
jgi:hypothetical protein